MRAINPELTIEWLLSKSSGRGTEVAVIDSGVDATHPDLCGRVVRACTVVDKGRGRVEVAERPAEAVGDETGHGTAVGGLILNLAPQAGIINIRVLDRQRQCSESALTAAFSWAIRNGIKLINMGVATSIEKKATMLKGLCERAYYGNHIVVAPNHNSGRVSFPAAFSSVIGVNCGSFDKVHALKYCNGGGVEFVASGMKIRAAAPNGRYTLVSGTSFAAANVTGIIALLLEVMPQLSVFEVKSILKDFASAGA